jgi:hypothetical protein
VCTITVDFPSTSAIAASSWYLTVDTVSNVDYLEGETVSVITDGGVHPDVVVTDGVINLDYQASVVHFGLPVKGLIKSMNLEIENLFNTKIAPLLDLWANTFKLIGTPAESPRYAQIFVDFSAEELSLKSTVSEIAYKIEGLTREELSTLLNLHVNGALWEQWKEFRTAYLLKQHNTINPY